MSREIFSIWFSVLIALLLISNFLGTAWDRRNRSLHFWTVSQLRRSVWGPVKTAIVSLFLSVFTWLSKREIQPSRPAKSLLSPFLIASYPLKIQLFSFLSLKMNSPINPSSTDHSEKERKRERWLELCVCEVSFFIFFFNQSLSPQSRNVAVCGPLPI